jgi:hypothetical protein
MNWIYRVSDNAFLYGGPYEVTPAAGQDVLVCVRHPNPRTERYDGAATAQEVIDYDAEQLDGQVTSQFDNLKTEKAILLVVRAYCNALKGGTYTTQSVAELKAAFIAAYKSL